MSHPFVFLMLILVGASSARADSGDWQSWEREVREGSLSREEGQKILQRWEGLLEDLYPEGDGRMTVHFPLAGYGVGDMGGGAEDGYRTMGYHFLDGNRHRGHPARDIFIRDRNADCLDDRTGRPVDVLAVADGVVLAVFREWRNDAEVGGIRGGNYLWIYHPGPKAFSYYAHLGEICVALGDRVQAGERIATLGRTGKNACRSGSPTHLHLMLLKAGGMEPMDPYGILRTGTWPVRRR